MEGEELHEHHEGMGSGSGSGGQTESEVQKRESILSHLPSPPLTRVGTRESGWKSEAAEGDIELGELGDANSVETGTGKKVEEEKDLAELDLSGMDPNQTVVGEGCSVVEESTPPKPIRRNSALHLAIHPPSPQPWEIIDPPDSDDDIERYPRAGPKRFDVIQNQLSARRPLIPKSAYYFGPPPADSAYGTPPIGQIGLHHPREILRIERDYTGGELIQFAPIYPLELAGRITPTQFLESINAINELLISAHSLRHAFFDNFFAVFTLHLSRLFFMSHYEKEMRRLKLLFQYLNEELYNPVGLNILWPQKVAFLFIEIEYY